MVEGRGHGLYIILALIQHRRGIRGDRVQMAQRFVQMIGRLDVHRVQ